MENDHTERELAVIPEAVKGLISYNMGSDQREIGEVFVQQLPPRAGGDSLMGAYTKEAKESELEQVSNKCGVMSEVYSNQDSVTLKE